jgi:ADP-ribosylglycohydrolase
VGLLLSLTHCGPLCFAAAAAAAAAVLLQLSGVLRMTPMGLLLLRRLPQLTKLRLEQWTNMATDVSIVLQYFMIFLLCT